MVKLLKRQSYKEKVLGNNLRIACESGQALLIVLLTVSVAIMVVLSVVSKSVTDIAITSTEEDSQRAFSAAEAGVEEVLANLVPVVGYSGSVGNSNYSVDVVRAETGQSFNYPEQLLSGDTATIWFVSRNNSGVFSCNVAPENLPCTRTNSVYFYWGTSPVAEVPAVEVTFYYDPSQKAFLNPRNNSIDYSGVKARVFAYDPDSARASTNNFIVAETGNYQVAFAQSTTTYRYRARISGLNGTVNNCINGGPANNCLIMAKVRLLYNSTTSQGFGVSVQGGDLPAQGYKISSTGKAGDGGNTQRKVEVFQGYPEPPSIFDSTLFSLRGLEK